MNIWDKLAKVERDVVKLQEEVAEIHKTAERDMPLQRVRCPLCSGKMNTVNTEVYHCAQTWGLCGYAVGIGKKGSAHPSMHFQRTRYDKKEDDLVTPAPDTPNLGVAWFVGGQSIGLRGYMNRFKEWRDAQNEER